MKIVSFEDGGPHLGVVEGDNVIDLQAADASAPTGLGDWLRRSNGDLKALADLAAKAPASARRPLAGLKFALPVRTPGKIICLGLNYLDHVKEGPQKDNIPKFQSIFFRTLTSLTPHLQPLMRPQKSIQFDYEGELVVIIGKRAKHLTMGNAVDCIAGFCCGNEGSIREYQRHTTQWGMGKNFDRTGSVGPWMVTADELPVGRQGPQDRNPAERQHHAVVKHRPLHVSGGGIAGLSDRGHDAGAGRYAVHRHTVRRRSCPQAQSGVDEGGRQGRSRDRGHRHAMQSDRGREALIAGAPGFQARRH